MRENEHFCRSSVTASERRNHNSGHRPILAGRRLQTVVLAVVIGTLGAGGACRPADSDAPELPPADTMKMDMSFPADQGGALVSAENNRANYSNAAIRVFALNAAVLLALAPPAVALAAALNTVPAFEEGKWHWRFSATNGTIAYDSELTGWFEGNARTGAKLKLNMVVSCPACVVPTTDFLWYEGEFETSGTNGYWLFYNPEISQEDKKFVKMEYTLTDATHRSLTFTNIRTDGHEDAGDLIDYSRDGDAAKVLVSDKSKNEDYEVGWSISDRDGFIHVPGYNNGERACWNESLINTACEDEGEAGE
ncbi:MAG: hypothetical protein V2A73_14475 [Pseudomonadota bacterium]